MSKLFLLYFQIFKEVFSIQISNFFISISARNSYGGRSPASYIQIFDVIFEVRCVSQKKRCKFENNALYPTFFTLKFFSLTVFGFLISSVRKTLFGVIWVTSLSFFGPVKLIRVFSILCRKKCLVNVYPQLETYVSFSRKA